LQKKVVHSKDTYFASCVKYYPRAKEVVHRAVRMTLLTTPSLHNLDMEDGRRLGKNSNLVSNVVRSRSWNQSASIVIND